MQRDDAMEKIIKAAVERGASDLHIKAGDVFRARIAGKLVPLTKQALTPDQTKSIALKLIPNEDDRNRIDKINDFDCSWGAPGIGRFRVNILRQRSSFMIVMRVIPFELPSIERLAMPSVLKSIADAASGMVLVTGTAGSGRSTTMAALVNHINQHNNKHIVTLENPIEFLHRDLQSSVTQREVGVDTDTYRSGLRAALRQDPDVVLLGEMREPETLETALKAAETGHLLFSSLHTPDAVSTVQRIISLYPPEDQDVTRVRLAEALHAVISQRLMPRTAGDGRVAVMEILIVTPEVREILLDGSRIGELHDAIAAGNVEHGSQTFAQHLDALAEEGVIDADAAAAAKGRRASIEMASRTKSAT
jgi:twitching motility protein PilT